MKRTIAKTDACWTALLVQNGGPHRDAIAKNALGPYAREVFARLPARPP